MTEFEKFEAIDRKTYSGRTRMVAEFHFNEGWNAAIDASINLVDSDCTCADYDTCSNCDGISRKLRDLRI